jgi:uncharacterized protein YfaP (DUF2135 family)
LTNAAVTIGTRTNVAAPFVHTPTSLVNTYAFTITRPNVSLASTVSLSITDECGPWTTFVGVGAGAGVVRGNLGGTVRNVSTSQPVVGATVTVRGTGRTATTNANGAYSIADLATGAATVDIAASGFVSQSVNVSLAPNATAAADVSLMPSASAQPISVALTWGASPADLDLHLSGPLSGTQRFHLYWNNPAPAPQVAFSGEDANGYGPETATIQRVPNTGAWVAGQYRFWVHNYSSTPGFGGSSARITVTRGGQQLGAYDVASASGTNTLPLWQAVTLNVDASGNVSLAPVQQFVSGGSSSVLRIYDGTADTEGDDFISWPTSGKP